MIDPEVQKLIDDVAVFKTAVNAKIADLRTQIAGIAMPAADKAALTALATDIETATAALPSE